MFVQFDTLDIAVQEEFEKFLTERGINDALAMFIPEYAEHKEQKVRLRQSHWLCLSANKWLQEYVGWLNNVKKFIEA